MRELVRNQSFIRFAGEGTKAAIRGVSLLRGKDHVDNTLLIEHAAPHCESREQFSAVLDDEAHSVFQGKIVVEPHAQKTDAKMMTRALLLSERPRPTTSRSWKSSPTTWSAATAPPPVRSIRASSSI